jgi:hypothetical protein
MSNNKIKNERKLFIEKVEFLKEKKRNLEDAFISLLCDGIPFDTDVLNERIKQYEDDIEILLERIEEINTLLEEEKEGTK